MKIAIDLRSLTSGSVSGVENYTLNLLGPMLAQDKQNSYTLFYNSWSRGGVRDFHFINSRVKHTRLPNKLLNLGLKTKSLSLEKLIGPFDCLFMPNLNQFNVSPRAKLAITVHDLSPTITPEFYNLRRRLWHKFLNYRQAYQRANIIFAVSEYTKQYLIRIYDVGAEKIKVVYPGIDHRVFNPEIDYFRLRSVRNRYSLPGEYILFLNTIEPRKNLVNLVKAFKSLDSDAHLVIAGKKGWKYREIFNQVRNSPKFAKIHYVGYLPEADKPAIIKLAKVLAYPSFYEGFGFQPLEAMALGVPTLVSQVTSLPEVTAEAAMQVNPYNVADIAAGLKAILENNSLRQSLIARGRQQAAKFNWEKTSGEVLDGLNSLR